MAVRAPWQKARAPRSCETDGSRHHAAPRRARALSLMFLPGCRIRVPRGYSALGRRLEREGLGRFQRQARRPIVPACCPPPCSTAGRLLGFSTVAFPERGPRVTLALQAGPPGDLAGLQEGPSARPTRMPRGLARQPLLFQRPLLATTGRDPVGPADSQRDTAIFTVVAPGACTFGRREPDWAPHANGSPSPWARAPGCRIESRRALDGAPCPRLEPAPGAKPGGEARTTVPSSGGRPESQPAPGVRGRVSICSPANRGHWSPARDSTGLSSRARPPRAPSATLG